MSGTIDGPRTVRPEELAEAIELIDLVFRTSGGKSATMRQEFPLLLSAENCPDLYVTKVDGRIVSHVGVYRQTMMCDGVAVPAACLGAVCTHPEHRGAGLAGDLTDLVMETSRQQGCLLMPISGGRSLYVRRGAHPIEPAQRVMLGREDGKRFQSAGVEIEPYQDRDLPELLALQADQLVRYLWTAEVVRVLLKAHLDLSCSAWSARDGAGRLVGFLLVMHRGPMSGKDPTVGRVINHVGRAETLGPLAARALRELGLRGLQIMALPGETDAVAGIGKLGVAAEPGSSRWTLKVLDLAELLKRLAGRFARAKGLAVRSANGGERLVIEMGQERIELTGTEQVNAALFNGPEAWPEAMQGLGGRARKQLERVLPVPIPNYGLNYI